MKVIGLRAYHTQSGMIELIGVDRLGYYYVYGVTSEDMKKNPIHIGDMLDCVLDDEGESDAKSECRSVLD